VTPLALVSGKTTASPYLAACSKIADLVLAFSSVQVSPESQYKTGGRESSLLIILGMKIEKVISH